MEVKEAFLNGQKLRYIELLENGLLFNTKDYCRIVGIKTEEREKGTVLGAPCIDQATACLNAGEDESSLEWLIENFSQYEKETLIHPRCDDEWKF